MIDSLKPDPIQYDRELQVYFTVLGGRDPSPGGRVTAGFYGLRIFRPSIFLGVGDPDAANPVPPLTQGLTHSSALSFDLSQVHDWHSGQEMVLKLWYQERDGVGTWRDKHAASMTVTVPPPPITDQLQTAEIILFNNAWFDGSHTHVFGSRAVLEEEWDNKTSSFAVLRGEWELFAADWHSYGRYYNRLGPGLYPWGEDVAIENDDMSSLRPGGEGPIVHGMPLRAHAILFQEPGFRGMHTHVFTDVPDLRWWSDRVSSIIVLRGNWSLYSDTQYQHRAGNVVLGPGLYPALDTVDIRNDDVSSLRGTDEAANASGMPLEGHVILFQDPNFTGKHHHVLAADTRLGFWDNRVSSIAVLGGTWSFFSDYDYDMIGEYANHLVPGLYGALGDVGFPGDDLSSLRPVSGGDGHALTIVTDVPTVSIQGRAVADVADAQEADSLRILRLPPANEAAQVRPSPQAEAQVQITSQVLARMHPTDITREVVVPADALWVDTGLSLQQGQQFRIEAEGQWSNIGPPSLGPDGFKNYLYPGTLLPDAALASLIGKVGDVKFAVGGAFEGVSPAAGKLFLAINDTPDTYADNQGMLRVNILVPAEAQD